VCSLALHPLPKEKTEAQASKHANTITKQPTGNASKARQHKQSYNKHRATPTRDMQMQHSGGNNPHSQV